MSTGASKDKQNRPESTQVKDKYEKSLYTTPPASLGESGKISPNSNKRGKQG